MGLSFYVFRGLLSAFLVLLSLVTMSLSFCLLKEPSRRPTACVMIIIEAGSMIRALLPVMHRYWFKSIQTVASEAIGLFVLLPFQLIMSIVIVTIFLNTESPTTINDTLYALRILIFMNTSTHLLYTFLLVLTICLTIFAFDKDVWYRDIDSRPSPFPMAVLGSFFCVYLCPCMRNDPPNEMRQVEHERTTTPTTCQCISQCNCAIKSLHTQPDAESQMSAPTPRSSFFGGGPQSASRSLVRIPDAVERRSSIMIAFEV